MPRFAHLQTDAGWVHLGAPGSTVGAELYKTGSSGHSGYPHNAMDQMNGFNLAAILLDRSDLAARAEPFG